MSASPVIALRKAIRTHLLADAPLAAALSGDKVYDEAPRNADPPYVLFVDSQLRDWSADSSRGAEQFLTIAILTTARGLSGALDIAQMIVDLLDDAPLTLEDHALINLRFQSMETRREQSGRFARVAMRLRATTEYL